MRSRVRGQCGRLHAVLPAEDECDCALGSGDGPSCLGQWNLLLEELGNRNKHQPQMWATMQYKKTKTKTKHSKTKQNKTKSTTDFNKSNVSKC